MAAARIEAAQASLACRNSKFSISAISPVHSRFTVMPLRQSCLPSWSYSMKTGLSFTRRMPSNRVCQCSRVRFDMAKDFLGRGSRRDLAMVDLNASFGVAGRRSLLVRAQRSRFAKKYSKSSRDDIEKLVSNLCKSREEASETLENYGRFMNPPDWFDVLDGIGRRRRWLLALEVFRWIQGKKWYKPDSGYYSKLISIMGKEKQYRMAMTMFKEMRKIGCRPDTSLYNSVMTLHLRCEDSERGFVKARALLEEMKLVRRCQPNVVTYNILTRAAAQLGNHEILNLLLRDLFDRDLTPDHYTFNGIMDAYGKAREVGKMEEVLKRMRTNQLKPDEVTFNTLIDAYGKAGEFDKMDRVLSSMTTTRNPPVKPGVRTYNSMITSYGNGGLVEKLDSVFEEMEDTGVLPTFMTYEVIIDAYGRCGEFCKMKMYVTRMKAAGFALGSSTLNKMLEAYCHHGMTSEAEALLTNSVKECGVEATPLSYAIVIRAHSKAGQRNEMEALLDSMKSLGLKPTKHTYLNFMEQFGLQLSDKQIQDSEIAGTVKGLDDLSTRGRARKTVGAPA